MLQSIPEELKKYNHWCVSTSDDKAPKLPGSDGLYNASPTEGPWLSFDEACKVAKQYDGLIGFVLTKNDPFVCIDLDIKDAESVDKKTNELVPMSEWSTAQDLDRYQRIISQFNSYTELSSSGKGAHVWIKAVLTHGMRRGGVEVYPNERYIICTGYSASDVYFDMSTGVCITEVNSTTQKDIIKNQEMLNVLIDEMGKPESYVVRTELVEVPPIHSDDAILEQANKARNDVKFKDLFAGNYQKYTIQTKHGPKPKFKSQSEADYALMSMLCFYSKCNSQVRRLFRMSELGKREKAMKNDRYIDINLTGIRSREAQTNYVNMTLDIQSKALMQKSRVEKIKPVVAIPPIAEPSEIEWPPGLTGEIAQFIYHSSTRQVPEVAIATAISLMAGFVGKAYNISNTGLNLYTVIVARSGVGKDAMFEGTNALVSRLQGGFATVTDYIDTSKYVSASALIKGCSERSSFVNIMGEIGQSLFTRLANDNRDTQIRDFKTVLLSLYGQSGKSSKGLSLKYSSKENNVDGGSGIAYSLLGETTPGTFYESLTNSMMSDGFMSRFLIIEYAGDRPDANPNPITTPSKELCEKLYQLLAQVATLDTTGQVINVEQSPAASKLAEKFDHECDELIRGEENESKRQMYVRAHLKTLRLAAQFAVGKNKLHPVVDTEDYKYAMKVVKADIKGMKQKLQDGHIGSGDNPRELRLLAILREYVEKKPTPGYKTHPKLYADGRVTRRYLQARCSAVSAFYSHKNGANFAFKSTIDSLIDSGHIIEMNKFDLVALYGEGLGRCYQILNLD